MRLVHIWTTMCGGPARGLVASASVFIRRSLRFPGSRGCTWSLLVPVHSSPLPRLLPLFLTVVPSFEYSFHEIRATDMLPWTWIDRWRYGPGDRLNSETPRRRCSGSSSRRFIYVPRFVQEPKGRSLLKDTRLVSRRYIDRRIMPIMLIAFARRTNVKE